LKHSVAGLVRWVTEEDDRLNPRWAGADRTALRPVVQRGQGYGEFTS